MSTVLAQELVGLLTAQGKRISTVESCTGGLVAGAITAISGSSAVFDYGFVTYSNAAKTRLVHVPQALIEANGAVSLHVARAMAEGALREAGADIALSITGIAGPTGGTADKPVGMVCFGLSRSGRKGETITEARIEQFGPIGRDAVRGKSVELALSWALSVLKA
jgi:nicotinamide-nucleotide amidase